MAGKLFPAMSYRKLKAVYAARKRRRSTPLSSDDQDSGIQVSESSEFTDGEDLCCDGSDTSLPNSRSPDGISASMMAVADDLCPYQVSGSEQRSDSLQVANFRRHDARHASTKSMINNNDIDKVETTPRSSQSVEGDNSSHCVSTESYDIARASPVDLSAITEEGEDVSANSLTQCGVSDVRSPSKDKQEFVRTTDSIQEKEGPPHLSPVKVTISRVHNEPADDRRERPRTSGRNSDLSDDTSNSGRQNHSDRQRRINAIMQGSPANIKSKHLGADMYQGSRSDHDSALSRNPTAFQTKSARQRRIDAIVNGLTNPIANTSLVHEESPPESPPSSPASVDDDHGDDGDDDDEAEESASYKVPQSGSHGALNEASADGERSHLTPVRRSKSYTSTAAPKHARSLQHRMLTLSVNKQNGTQDTVAEGAKQRKLSNVAKNVRTMLSIFKRRASDASTQLPSAELVEKWAENFSNLLNDKYGLMLFRSFLCSEYSEENIEFWIACEEYKHLKAKQLAQKAQKIYSDFVTVHAPKEVNLDSKTRLETMKNLSAPDKMTFEQAQSRIQCLMEKDSYPRFLRSQLYLNTLKQAQECSV